jgi:subtilisin family serine protease
VPPPVTPSDDPRNVNQRYLDFAPKGINARWTWTRADGTGVGFVDMERGWMLNHEDLAAANISLISGLSQDFHGHGTAVLGEVVGVDNTLGGVGIAPNASARVVSQWRNASTYNTAEANKPSIPLHLGPRVD